MSGPGDPPCARQVPGRRQCRPTRRTRTPFVNKLINLVQLRPGGGNAGLLDLLPQGAVDPTLLSEDEQRDLYVAFHLQVRYDRPEQQVTLRVTIYAEAVGA